MSYGYKARELDKTVIDWASVTKSISDNLSTEKKRREGLKLKLEEQHAEQLQKVDEFEQGINPDLNVFAMKQAQQTREFLLMNHKLMTSGLKSVDESKLIKQNVMNTWSALNTSLKTYNANALRLNELDGKGNEAVLKAMANQLEIQNKQIYHDPNTGAGYYASLDKDGNIDMNTLVPVRALNNIQSQSFETFDVDSESSKVARNVAEWKTFITSTQDLTDARGNPNYVQWIDNQTKKALSNDERVASVLMDYLGIEYDVDGNPSKRTVTYKRVKEYKTNGEMIMEDVTEEIGDVEMRFDKSSGKLVPKLTEEQKKLAKAAYQNAIEIQIGREATKQYVAPITKSGDEKSAENTAGYVEMFVTKGDFSALKAALAGSDYTGVEPPDSNGVIRLIDSKGEKKEVQTKGKTAKQVGFEISGFLGRTTANAFNKRSVSGSLNTNILTNKDQYGTFVTSTPKIKQEDLSAFELANIKQNAREINPMEVKAATQTLAQSIGIPTSSITVKNNKILYNNKEIGTLGVTGGAEIKSKLEQLTTVKQPLPGQGVKI